MIRIGNRNFRKCLICGTHGHPKGICPLADYEKELEAGTANLMTAEKLFPNNPALVAKLKAMAVKRYVLPELSGPDRTEVVLTKSSIDLQVARLRQAWGLA